MRRRGFRGFPFPQLPDQRVLLDATAGKQARRKTPSKNRPFPRIRPLPRQVGRFLKNTSAASPKDRPFPKPGQIGPNRQVWPNLGFSFFSPGAEFGVSYFSRCYVFGVPSFPGLRKPNRKRPHIGSPRGHFGQDFAAQELDRWATFWAVSGPWGGNEECERFSKHTRRPQLPPSWEEPQQIGKNLFF